MEKARVNLTIGNDELAKMKTWSARMGVSVSSFVTYCTMQQIVLLEQMVDKVLAMSEQEFAVFTKTIEALGGSINER